MNELKLVELAQKGQPEAFSGLYQLYFESLYVFVRSKVDSNERAEDMCADAFAKAFEKLSSFSAKSSFKTWLYTIARNIVNDWYRRKARVKFFSINNILPMIEGLMQEEENLEESSESDLHHDIEIEVEGYLKSLPDKYAEVLRLRFLANLSIKEVAEVLDTTENNVKVMQNRAIKKIQINIKNSDN